MLHYWKRINKNYPIRFNGNSLLWLVYSLYFCEYLKMKLSPYALQTNITNMARHHFESQPSAQDTRTRFSSYIEQLKLDDKTKGGKLRYPKKTLGEIQRIWFALTETYTGVYCVFGYWYEGEFYTTYKGCKGLKTTEILHNLEQRLTSEQWDRLESGLYYKDTLKKYY